jgi:puromycin-sensitive aminopeptidase
MSHTTRSAYRLPRTTIPRHYNLILEPDLDRATFTGTVSIIVAVNNPISKLLINAVEIDIIQAWLMNETNRRIDIKHIAFDKATERASITFLSKLTCGVYTLNMNFTGILNEKLFGFYLCRFRDKDGTEHTIATTQMQGTNARRVFPCFDEPSFKATFSTTLIVPPQLYVVSNTPIKQETVNNDGKREVRFEDTIKMSPYLLAFVVGPLEATEPMDIEGVALRTIYTPGKRNLARFALEIGAFALRYFVEKYRLPYPGNKLDQVAVPDFAAAGMENVGCCIYREVILLLDARSATQAEMIRSADVIAHEIAHMWFGNLVTMEWWNELWLNEAFATFMGISCVAVYKPEWDRWTLFSLERTKAFDIDSLQSTRTLEYSVRSPHEAVGMLDALTYQKGASVLRMLEQFVGTDQFFHGVSLYLREHAYGNTTGDDLWAAIERASEQPVKQIMNCWVFGAGYPLLIASLSEDRKKLTISQKRFRLEPRSEDERLFSIPLVFRSYGPDGSHTHRLLLQNRSGEFEFEEPVDTVVLNAGGYGFYRVQYQPVMLQSLASRMAKCLTAIERYTLIDDTWALVLGGEVTSSEFLELVMRTVETNLHVWVLLSNCLDSLDRVLDGKVREEYGARIRGFVSRAQKQLGWAPKNGESCQNRELRGLLIRLLATTGFDEVAIARARKLHEIYLTDPSSIEPNLAAAVTAAVAVNGREEDYQILLDKCRKPLTPQEEQRYQKLLGLFPGDQHMDRTLEMCLQGGVRIQDAPHLLAVCLRNRDHGIKAWQFVKENWEYINRVYPPITIAPFLGSVTSLTRRHEAVDVLAFFENHDVPQGHLMLVQHLERLRVNVAFRQREAAHLSSALLAHG